MNRLFLILIASTLIGLSVLSGVVFWLFKTPDGARQLLQAVVYLSDFELTLDRLDGNLAEELWVEGLNFSSSEGELKIGFIHIVPETFGIFPPTVSLRLLELEQLTLYSSDRQENGDSLDLSAESQSADEMAGISELPLWLTAEIHTLKVTDFVYIDLTEPEEETIIADLVAGHYRLAEGKLVANEFTYHSPYVELDGSFRWTLEEPHLSLKAEVHLPETCVDPELFRTIQVPVRFPGHLELDGDWTGYSGLIRVGDVDRREDAVWLTAKAQGTWEGLRLDDLAGHYLQGTLNGHLDMNWADDYQLDGFVNGKDLNPQTLDAQLDGRMTLEVSGALSVPYDDNPLEATLDTRILSGSLRGHTLHGRVSTNWAGTELVTLDVDLIGDEAMVMAKGDPKQHVEINFRVSEFGHYHPELSGSVKAQGWLRWSGSKLYGELSGVGRNLAWREARVKTVQFETEHSSEKKPFRIQLTGSGMRYGNLNLDRTQASLSGWPVDHHLQLSATGDLGEFLLTADGQYDAEGWEATVSRVLAENTPWGSWTMKQATEVRWHSGTFSVKGFEFLAKDGSLVRLTAHRWGEIGAGSLDLAWQNLDLSLLAPVLSVELLSGRSTGQFHCETDQGQPLVMQGELTAKGRFKKEHYNQETHLETQLDWDAGGLLLSGMLRGDSAETADIKVSSKLSPRWSWPSSDFQASLNWHQLALQRFSGLASGLQVDGVADGKAFLERANNKTVRASARIDAEGRLMEMGRELGPRQLQLDLHWDALRFHCAARLSGMHGGSASLRLTSHEDPQLLWPDSGQINLLIEGFNFAALEPWLPESLALAGHFDGQAQGTWVNRNEIDLEGQLRLAESRLSWSSEEGQISLPVRDATAFWQWRGKSLSGTLELNLSEHGNLHGHWHLPIPARYPMTIHPEATLKAGLKGKVKAFGLLSTIGPWLVQDAKGQLEADLQLSGTWNKPELQGHVGVLEGGFYLPAAGIHIEDLTLEAKLQRQRITIERLTLKSGAGDLDAGGEIVLDQMRLVRYGLDITGRQLTIMDFPEVRLVCNPDLHLSGDLRGFKLRGKVHVPELAIRGSRSVPKVLPNKDVSVVKPEVQREELSFATDVEVDVTLGDMVTVVSGGVDTRLAGGGTVVLSPKGELLANGEIRLVEGSFAAYGARLQVRKGLIRYSGTPVTNPRLNIFAAREVGTVLAGVQVSGTAQAPVVTLYSRPSMPERDILGYILMGRAIRADEQETDMLMMGAGAIMPVYGKPLSFLGITEVDIQGLFVGAGGIRLRKRLTEKWELESTLGIESGVDLYYVIEFE